MAATTNNSSLVAAEILPDTLLDHYRSLVQIFPDSSDQIIQNLLAFEGQPNLQDRVVQAILKESTDGNDDFLAMSPANVSIADQLLLMAQELAAKFPDANANVIYSRLERAIGNLVPLEEEKAKIQAELERPPEDDQPGPSWKDAGIPPLERQSHSTREHFAFLTKKEQGDFVSLLQMFPTIDNKFLLEEIAVNCKTAEELIDKFSQDDSYPKKADRLKREQLERHRNTLLSPESFDSREFILTFPDPERYFADIQRPVSSDYADLARVHLANVFPHLHLDFIKSTLARYNNHLSPALRELQADTTGTGKKPLAPLGKRSLPASNKFEKQPREEKLPWPAKHDEIFFRELQFLTFEEKIQKFLKWRKAEAQLRIEAARERGEVAECPICLEETSQEDLVFCVKAEPHGYCEACVRSHAEVAIGEGSAAQVQCLQTDCDGQIRVETLRHLISPNLLSLLLRKRAEDDIQSLVPGEREMIESCPFCPFAVILDTSPEEDKLFRCQNPDCLQESCRLCKGASHIPLKCDQVDQASLERFVENQMAEAMIRSCPHCKTRVIKDIGCNHMTCSRCRTHFCYNCNAKITPHLLNDHFINDASCSTVDNFRLNEERAIKAGQEARKKYLELHPDAKVNVEELNMKGLVERKGERESAILPRLLGNNRNQRPDLPLLFPTFGRAVDQPTINQPVPFQFADTLQFQLEEQFRQQQQLLAQLPPNHLAQWQQLNQLDQRLSAEESTTADSEDSDYSDETRDDAG